MLVRLFINLSLFALTLVFARPAFSWDVCNETSYVLRVATVTSIEGTMTPQGWTKARPGQCLTFIAPPGQPRYVYAESSLAHQGGVREWKGVHNFCAADEGFKARTDISCALQGLDARDYLSVDPREEITIFTEPKDYGVKALTAGLQRLLLDNGYSTPTIDGISGRQTTRNLSAFLRAKSLPSSTPDVDQIDALELAALERRGDVGVHSCNKTDSRIWVATAYREGASWESRGWWQIEPESCVHVHSASIKSLDAHIFSLMEMSDGSPDMILKSNTAIASQFCIAEGRFSATDRENCAARGYSAASFRPLPSDKDGITLNFIAADYTSKNVGGLRQ